MSFSDDDLKHLKKLIALDELSKECDIEFSSEEISALLARLEAAEAVCHLQGFDTQKSEEYLNWCKACGK